MTESLPTFEDVRAAAARLAGRVLRTPLLRHPLLDEITGATVLVKPEPLQRTGSFKLRGATNAALLMDPDARRGGRDPGAQDPRAASAVWPCRVHERRRRLSADPGRARGGLISARTRPDLRALREILS